LLKTCWSPDAKLRPSFSAVVKELDEIILEVAISDPVGRKLWRDNFFGEQIVDWSSLSRVIGDYVVVDKNIDKKKLSMQYYALFLLLVTNNSKTIGSRVGDRATIERFGQILDWFGPIDSQQGMLNKIEAVLKEKWFHGDMDQKESESRLSTLSKDGSYLIRFSATARRCFTLSSKPDASTPPIHYRVTHKPSVEKFYFWDDKTKAERPFSDLPELISGLSEEKKLLAPCEGSVYYSALLKKPEEIEDILKSTESKSGIIHSPDVNRSSSIASGNNVLANRLVNSEHEQNKKTASWEGGTYVEIPDSSSGSQVKSPAKQDDGSGSGSGGGVSLGSSEEKEDKLVSKKKKTKDGKTVKKKKTKTKDGDGEPKKVKKKKTKTKDGDGESSPKKKTKILKKKTPKEGEKAATKKKK